MGRECGQSPLVHQNGSMVVTDARTLRLSHADAQLEHRASHSVPSMPLHLLSWDGNRIVGVGVQAADRGPVVEELDLNTGVTRTLLRPFQASPALP